MAEISLNVTATVTPKDVYLMHLQKYADEHLDTALNPALEI